MRALALAAVAVAMLLGGCATDAPEPSGASDPAGDAATGSTPAPQDAAPQDAAAGDAELDRFRAALEGHGPADPDALVAAIEAAGFPRGAIERTREVDSLGAPVTFMEIAVAAADGCLVGQVGRGEPVAQRAPALGGGRCLIGDVIALD